jgi:hypothetical protein
MSEAERDRLRARLDEFSRRLDARTCEFRERGELSDVHQSFMRQIHERREQLQAKLASAEASGSAWQVIMAECERDFTAIDDDLRLLDERADAGQMKQARR